MPDDEQRNRYRGIPPIPWVRIDLYRPDDGEYVQRQLAVDTGDPRAVRLTGRDLRGVQVGSGPTMMTNFGPAHGGWVRLRIPELGFERWTLAFATDALVDAIRQIDRGLDGQVGMEFLRTFEYGGNDTEFWIRRLSPR